MQNPRHGLVPGTLVDVRGRTWRLVDNQRFDRCSLVTLQGVDRDIGATLRVLVPFDRVIARRGQPRVRLGGLAAVRRRVTDAILTSHPWHGCWTAATAKLDLMSWQLEPALAVLGGATRVLLADAVGLGKTVQAGLIAAELSARSLIDRTLVLTPAGLRAQWAEELATRLDLHAAVLDQAALARQAANLPPDASPWAISPIVISSIDLVKRAEVLTAVDRVPFDLLIVDEAHHLTPGSDRGALVARLASRTPWVVLITATPHSGDDRAFAYLRDIGSRGNDTLTIFRRTAPGHSALQQSRRMRARLVAVRASASEVELLQAVHAYAKAIWASRGVTSPAARLVAIVLSRRSASSVDALLASLVRRQSLLAGPAEPAAPDQASLPWEELDGGDGDVADSVLAAPGCASADEEHAWIDRLIDLARRARESATKAAWIQRFLARVREPVIVFSEYRDTIEALRARFEQLFLVVTLHGGLSPAMRRAATSAFVDGPAMLLLATDTGGEGLNLHARCRTVINVELPWNPLRLEQRVGRVDRIGQRRRVHAVHLMHTGSIEETVLAHLHRRVARAAMMADTGDADVEARVADAVLGGSRMPSLTPQNWPSASVPAARDEVRRLEMLRRLAQPDPEAGGARGSTSTVPVAAPRRTSRRPTTVLCAFRVTLAGDHGRVLAHTIMAASVILSRPLPSTRRELLAAVPQLTEHEATQRLVAASAAEMLRSSQSCPRDFARAVAARVAALSAPPIADRTLYQPALFDNRSAHLAAERSAVADIHRQHLVRLDRVLGALEAGSVQPPSVIGIWLQP